MPHVPRTMPNGRRRPIQAGCPGPISGRPRLIVRPVDNADIAAAVRWAGEVDLSVGVRGGGHSVAGHSMPDAALLIDLSGWRDCRCGPDRLGAGRRCLVRTVLARRRRLSQLPGGRPVIGPCCGGLRAAIVRSAAADQAPRRVARRGQALAMRDGYLRGVLSRRDFPPLPAYNALASIRSFRLSRLL